MHRTMKLFTLLCFILTFQPAQAQDFIQPITPEQIRQAYLNYSPVKIVKELTRGDEKDWNTIMDHIASGDREWLQVSVYLLPGTDAGTATHLIVSLAEALPKNPQGVLSLENSMFSLKSVCSLPFIEPEDDFIINYGETTIKALESVMDETLQTDKKICIMRLKEALEIAKKVKQ